MKIKGIHKLTMFIAVGGLCAGVSAGSSPGDLFSELRKPYSSTLTNIRHLNDAIGALLLKMPSVSPDRISIRSLRESYLLVTRQYFKCALHAHDSSLRSVLLLHAHRLWRAYPAFAKLVKQVVSNPSSYEAAYKALSKFQKASMDIDTTVNSWSDLNHFQNRLLHPLAPLAALSGAADKVVIWPVQRRQTQISVIPMKSSKAPPISQTIASLPSVNITSRMRNVFTGVLRQLQTQLMQNPTDKRAQHYYHIILQCLKLSEHLQQASILSLQVQKSFNHRLMLALLFFKDIRTRSGAVRRLEFIGRIVNAMELISTAPVSEIDKSILNRRVHHIMTNLDQRTHVQRYVTQLDAISSFLRATQALKSGDMAPSPPPYTLAKHHMLVAYRKLISTTIHSIHDGVSVHKLRTVEMQLHELTSNIRRIDSMPSEAQQALLYHPQSPGGIRRNLSRWAYLMGQSPTVDSNASREFDRFGRTLKLLAGIHLELIHLKMTTLIDQLSAHRYLKLVSRFRINQQTIINSLATRKPAPDELVSKLRRQMRLLRAVQHLGDIISQKNQFVELNEWSPWLLNHAARDLWIQQMSESVAHQFEADTGLNSTSDAWLSFRVAAPAIKTVYRAVTVIAPKLRADPKQWVTAYLQVTLPPPKYAIAGAESDDVTLACMLLRSAEANETHGHFQAATDLFRKANHVMAGILISHR